MRKSHSEHIPSGLPPRADVVDALWDFRFVPTAVVSRCSKTEAPCNLGDYRIVEGVSFPFKFKHDAGGQEVDIQYDKVTINPKLGNDLFQ